MQSLSKWVRAAAALAPVMVSTRSTSGSPASCGVLGEMKTQTRAFTPGWVSSSWSWRVSPSSKLSPVALDRSAALSGQPVPGVPSAAADVAAGALVPAAPVGVPDVSDGPHAVAAMARAAVLTSRAAMRLLGLMSVVDEDVG